MDTPDAAGVTAVEMLRRADMGGIARRLEAVAKERFSSTNSGGTSSGLELN